MKWHNMCIKLYFLLFLNGKINIICNLIAQFLWVLQRRRRSSLRRERSGAESRVGGGGGDMNVFFCNVVF